MQQTNWNEIYTKQSPKLLGICRRYIKDVATAEDIVHDSFIVAIQKENDLKNKELLNGWLSRIVINRAINYLKNENKIKYVTTENVEYIDETTMTNTLALGKKSIILASDFSQEDLLEAIDTLSENHKSVFNLYIIDQFSHLEISNLLKISVGTSKSSLSRARKNVQDFLLEKLNNNKSNEKKKRRILFLLFLGLGNQLIAQKFKKSFSNFEIQPKKGLNLSRKVTNPTIDFALNASKPFPFFKVGFGILSFAFVLFYFINKETSPVLKQIQTIKIEPVKNIFLIDTPNNKTTTKQPDVDEKRGFVKKEVKKNKVVVNSSKSIILPTNVATTDSIAKEEPPKVVVVKKRIVKKDTVYVQK